MKTATVEALRTEFETIQAWGPAREPSGDERLAFARQRGQLLRRYPGQYVAFYRRRLVGHDLNDEILAQRMFEKYGDVPFLIARVEQAATACEVPSPELLP
jgi:hypothetical protein